MSGGGSCRLTLVPAACALHGLRRAASRNPRELVGMLGPSAVVRVRLHHVVTYHTTAHKSMSPHHPPYPHSRRHQMLLEALLPKQMLRHLHSSDTSLRCVSDRILNAGGQAHGAMCQGAREHARRVLRCGVLPPI